VKSLFFILFFVSFVAAAQLIPEKDRAEIYKALEDQRVAWNKGDIEGYMSGYWNSDSLRFIGKKGIQYGWKATLENYRKGYPTKEAMGNLTFDVISLEWTGDNAAFMIGRWKLDYPDRSSAEGHFTLLYRKINGKWFIVADHSS